MCGRYNTFGPLSFKRRLRDYILGAGKKLSIKASNVLSTENTEITLTECISKATSHKKPEITLPSTSSNPQAAASNEAHPESNMATETCWEEFLKFEEDEEEDTLTRDITDDLEIPKTSDEFIEIDENIDDVDAILEDFESIKDMSFKLPTVYNIPEEEGFKYFAGFLGRKSDGLTVPDNNLVQDENFVSSQWIDSRNFGGMNYPRKTLLEDVKKMDKIFEQFHESSKDGLKRDKNITNDLVDILEKEFPNYEKKILKKFALSRSIFRMRYMIKLMSGKETLRGKKKKVDMLFCTRTSDKCVVKGKGKGKGKKSN